MFFGGKTTLFWKCFISTTFNLLLFLCVTCTYFNGFNGHCGPIIGFTDI